MKRIIICLVAVLMFTMSACAKDSQNESLAESSFESSEYQYRIDEKAKLLDEWRASMIALPANEYRYELQNLKLAGSEDNLKNYEFSSPINVWSYCEAADGYFRFNLPSMAADAGWIQADAVRDGYDYYRLDEDGESRTAIDLSTTKDALPDTRYGYHRAVIHVAKYRSNGDVFEKVDEISLQVIEDDGKIFVDTNTKNSCYYSRDALIALAWLFDTKYNDETELYGLLVAEVDKH